MDPDPFPPSPLLAGPGTRGWQGGSLWALPAGLPLPPATLGCPPGRESPAGAGRGLPTSGATSLRPAALLGRPPAARAPRAYGKGKQNSAKSLTNASALKHQTTWKFFGCAGLTRKRTFSIKKTNKLKEKRANNAFLLSNDKSTTLKHSFWHVQVWGKGGPGDNLAVFGTRVEVHAKTSLKIHPAVKRSTLLQFISASRMKRL